MGTLIEAENGFGNRPAEVNAHPTLPAPEPRECIPYNAVLFLDCTNIIARPGDAGRSASS